MARATEIELTSRSEGGAWNWRAVGARQPRGTLAGDLVPSGAAVGDVFRAELEFAVEGIEVVAVAPVKNERRDESRHQKIELIASPLRGPDVSVTYASGGARGGREGGRDGGRDGERRRSREDGARPPGRRPPRSGSRPRRRAPGAPVAPSVPVPGSVRPVAAGAGESRRARPASGSTPRAGSCVRSGRRPGPSGPVRARGPVAAPRAQRARAPSAGRVRGPGRRGPGGRAWRPPTATPCWPSSAPSSSPWPSSCCCGGIPAVRQAITEQNAAAGRDGPAVDRGRRRS